MHCKNISSEIYLFKDKNENTRTTCETYSKLTTKTTEQRQCRHFDVFTFNFEQMLCIAALFSAFDNV